MWNSLPNSLLRAYIICLKSNPNFSEVLLLPFLVTAPPPCPLPVLLLLLLFLRLLRCKASSIVSELVREGKTKKTVLGNERLSQSRNAKALVLKWAENAGVFWTDYKILLSKTIICNNQTWTQMLPQILGEDVCTHTAYPLLPFLAVWPVKIAPWKSKTVSQRLMCGPLTCWWQKQLKCHKMNVKCIRMKKYVLTVVRSNG